MRLSLAILICPLCAWGETVQVTDLSLTNVQAKVNTATAGDTLVLTNGAATWSGTGLTLDKAITLQGAGIGSTVITGSGTQIILLKVTSKTQLTRVTGITFNGNKDTIYGILATTDGRIGQAEIRRHRREVS